MVDSFSDFSEELNLSKAVNCSRPSSFRIRSGSFRARKTTQSVEFAAVDLTRPHSFNPGHDKARMHLLSQKRESDFSYTSKSRPQGRGDSAVASNPMDNSATPCISPTSSESPVERGRARVRRCASPDKKVIDLKGPVSPDRFIPSRQFDHPPSTSFHTSKVPQQLTPEEKLRRKRPPSADPFMPSRPRRSADAVSVQGPTGRRHSLHYGPHLVNDSAVVGNHVRNEASGVLRHVSPGSVWNVGGSSAVTGRPPAAVPDGAGGLHGSGTTAPVYVAEFMKKQPSVTDEREKFESRIAHALDIDPTTRLLGTSISWPLLESAPSPSSPDYEQFFPFSWKDNAWRRLEKVHWSPTAAKDSGETVPSRPFRVLEAPRLRDDFYCSALAYCSSSGILAVGLAHEVYLWTEDFGVLHPPFSVGQPANYVTSLSFSSENGGRSILAVGQHNGLLILWSTIESGTRFEIMHPSSIACVAFKQTTTCRLSERFSGMQVDVEDLAVGDESGTVWYYSVEWTDNDPKDWGGSIILLAKIDAHTQRICGLAWSPDDACLATGGNDNTCLLFELSDILPPQHVGTSSQELALPRTSSTICQNAFSCLALNSNPMHLFSRRNILSQLLPSWVHSKVKPAPSSPSIFKQNGLFISGGGRTAVIPSNRHKHRLLHSAAVKAIAFAPWQPSLLATGGGTNDRSIHFFHTQSGACLATINVYAQVTSLIWSKKRPEIAATFGYAQPEHSIRVAVFAWPSCEQVAAIPWGPRGSSADGSVNEVTSDCGRVLWAVNFPGCSYSLAPDTCDQDTVIDGGVSGRGRSERCRRKTALAVRPKEKEGGLWCSRTLEEGCIVVASSDQTVKFHEVWSGPRKTPAAACGLFGGSGILEELEGIENPGKEIIR